MATVVGHVLGRFGSCATRHLKEAAADPPPIRIYNTESRGPLHERLCRVPGYVASEYIGAEVAPGTVMDGVMHQDLMALSFADDSFDLVVSSDVFEHLPDPYLAHSEVYRVLRQGGRHVFTVPFHGRGYHDDVRARLTPDGGIEHLQPEIYHEDPVRPHEGVLVFTIFSLEMLVRLRDLGFVTYFYQLRRTSFGIVGDNAIVFEAVKAPWAWG